MLIEEMSGFYYLSSFWLLASEKQEAYFIAATGVNKIEALANMFRGWGLLFSIAVDDDKQGREVYKSLKLQMFGNQDELAKHHMVKLPVGTGIEDVFSTDDFRKYVLRDQMAVVDGANSEYPKKASLSKPVLAFTFALSVKSGNLKWADLDAESQTNITTTITQIVERLKNQGA